MGRMALCLHTAQLVEDWDTCGRLDQPCEMGTCAMLPAEPKVGTTELSCQRAYLHAGL